MRALIVVTGPGLLFIVYVSSACWKTSWDYYLHEFCWQKVLEVLSTWALLVDAGHGTTVFMSLAC